MGWRDAPEVDTAAETAAAPKEADKAAPANSFKAMGYPDPDASSPTKPPTSFEGAGYPAPDAPRPVVPPPPPPKRDTMTLMGALGAFDDFAEPSKKSTLYKLETNLDPWGYIYGAGQGLASIPVGVAHFAGHPLPQAIEDWAYGPSETNPQAVGRIAGPGLAGLKAAGAASALISKHKILTGATLLALDRIFPEWAQHARHGLDAIHLFGSGR